MDSQPSFLSFRPYLSAFCAIAFAFSAIGSCGAQTLPVRPFGALQWRSIGPFRGGRTVAVSGVPARPGTFFMAPDDGGVWKSIDYARTWQPLFDRQPTGSIGALAVAPSNPDVIYAGSGEGLRRPDLSTGDGMYRSVDGGRTWLHGGLRDGQQIAAIAIDPGNAQRLFVAVLGHPYGANSERGVYRSTDGGASYRKVLGAGTDVGAVSVTIDPNHADTVYAALWASRNGPWNLVRVYERYDRNGLYKSTDGGQTWRQLTSGLPRAVGRIGMTVAPSDSNRLFAIVETPGDGCGVFRSDTAGATWTQTNADARICGRADDFAGITADPEDRDTVYSANTTTYRSSDAGRTWTGIKGAPGGDDYHTIWIDPTNSNTILLGVDQGATLSTDRGATWSSWNNQPTAQFYHVITDDRFPYRVFGAQQDSGSAEILSRGNDGAITSRDFHPVGVEEYGYVAPDPLHPWLIYGGKVSLYNERTGQTQDVSPTYDRGRYRFDRTNPLVWNRVDKHELYLGLNVIFATRDGGISWRQISPDLTRANPGEPAGLGRFVADDPLAGKHRGVVYSLAPSYLDARLMWAGTDDGRVWRTPDDGRQWREVTPAGIGPWSRVTQIEASHFDTKSAYISVSRQRLDDTRPYMYRTHDGGAHWQRITTGIPANEPVNTVREDAKRPGLLFAGTEKTVYVSFNDGAVWQSLQANLPATSIRDLVEHENDLVVGTHGRSFWILDDIEPLREAVQRAAATSAYLYSPARAYRVRANTNTDTPLPPEEPAGQNPPDGAPIDYTLPPNFAGSVRLVIRDRAGRVVRAFASSDPAPAIDPQLNVPAYWIRAPAMLVNRPGAQRFVWDLREPPPRSVAGDFPIAAIVHDTPHAPQGVFVVPGMYTVRLTAGGRSYTKPLEVRLDPRVVLGASALREQRDLGRQIVRGMNHSFALLERAMRRHDRDAVKRYRRINAGLTQLLEITQQADAAPTAVARADVLQVMNALAVAPAAAAAHGRTTIGRLK